MHILASASLPILFISGLGVMVAAAVLHRHAASALGGWSTVGVFAIAAGDACLGESRSTLERSLKGLFAAVVLIAFTTTVWRDRRRVARERTAS